MAGLSIRWRMTIWNTLAFTVVLVGFGILIYDILRQTHYEQVDRALQQRWQQIQDDPRLQGEPEQRLQYWVGRFGKHVETVGAVFDGQGQALVQAEQFPAEAAWQPDRSSQSPPAQPQFDQLQLPGGDAARRMVASLSVGDRRYTLILLASLEHVHEEMTLVARALFVAVPITLVAAALLAYVLARRSLAPVEQLRKRTDEITAEKLDQRLPILNSGDELGLLAQTINAMIARLERSFNEVRRFTADASHELRTPIAVIRSEAELVLEGAAGLDEARSRCSSILEECSRLSLLTEQLLLLCREDAGILAKHFQSVDLSSLVNEVVEMMRPLAAARGLDLKESVAPGVYVCGNPERLRQMVMNLLDNAIKYTPLGQVRIAVERTGERATLRVEDTGIGIAPEHQSHVFERFYRVVRDDSTAGTGLGLSIVQSIVQTHGGSIHLQSTEGAGSSFLVHLPCMPSQPQPAAASS